MGKTSATERKAIRAYWRRKFRGDLLLSMTIGVVIAVVDQEFFRGPEDTRSYVVSLIQWGLLWGGVVALAYFISDYSKIRKKIKKRGLSMASFVNLPEHERLEIEITE